uniref:NADH-ubiquinone oxidoreductase chain 6 n=1 Tax=Odontobutis platycephala TaxID=325276 RepID=A9X1E8_9GOBI|nr:NADH dehydrogenase subunit 6 [Odontobutis platycephala]AAY18982.1 NADH dehydrogenase subunit 6 [Odontobutis platycephala]QRB83212.1 NADH dehydrogenase subunit 6 [Odontobutis platycephala]
MSYIMFIFMSGLIGGLVGVVSNPSPYFAAVGLVVASGAGCGLLVGHGAPFLSLVLFLIYLGGMLVVFAYSAALAAEPYPETLGSRPVMLSVVVYLGVVVVGGGLFLGVLVNNSWVTVDELVEFSVMRGDMAGVAGIYLEGGWMLVVGVWVLLLTLFVVLEVVRGLGRGALRAV